MKYFASRFYAFLVQHAEVLPFFVRSALQERSDELTADELAATLMPINMFAERVQAHDLPAQFYDAEALEGMTGDIMSFETQWEGTFRVLPELVAAGTKLTAVESGYTDDVQAVFYGSELIHVISLDKQASIFSSSPLYQDAQAIIDEVKTKVAALEIEMPDNFPWWKYIGQMDGVVEDGDY